MNNEHGYDVGGVFGASGSVKAGRRRRLLVAFTASLRAS